MIAAAVAALVLLAGPPAGGAPPPPPSAVPVEPPPPPPPPRRWISATVGLPAHLFLTGLEARGEVRAHDRLGIAAYGGLGSALGVGYAQLGGQLRWYAAGDFQHGLALGADVNYLDVDRGLELLGVDLFEARGHAVGIGGFVGYKVIAGPGFTFGLEVGLRRHAISYTAAEHVSGRDYGRGGEATLWWPLADLHLGWSF